MAKGILIAVVGPSGAGKDSLIDYARSRLAGDPSVLFVRRVVTRAAIAAAEDHASMAPAEFAAAEAAGEFAVCWDAHGLRYGIPASAREHVARGGVAVANGSRAALPDIRAAFGRLLTVQVSARPEILAARIAARGRESEAEILRRLQRGAMASPEVGDIVEIDNGGELRTAGDILVGTIRQALDASLPQPRGRATGGT